MSSEIHERAPIFFTSDNASGAHPTIMDAVQRVNGGRVGAYGADPTTAEFTAVIKQHFGTRATAYPVFNGTGANVTALAAAAPRWGAIICANSAHINVDETGSPERTQGLKLIPIDTPDGKLTPELVLPQLAVIGVEHHAQPTVISISQTTEYGTCYTVAEITALAKLAHSHNMRLHMDGARLANAAATLQTELRTLTSDAGVDILSLGGTKNGALAAEAVIVLNPELDHGMHYLRKQQTQLASKMRFISAQLLALYGTDLWLENAGTANSMATRLAAGLAQLTELDPAFRITQKVESNAVFATMPATAREQVAADFIFYDWPGLPNEVRLMCGWDSTVEEVDQLLAALEAALTKS
ncbi:threonine aldolase family protein [Canibacter zhoujuaniae]|uniref:threonine aldolase family protein n=1 Tax=Canibacter zhoujuaniae TaxID=2708343 RepID=UPI0014211AA9|nr:beta-eliminating lyase-related protein [Canibacter zhoujuaniae]